MVKEMTYDSATKRLQELVQEMEHGEPGPDRIAAIVSETRALMQFCLDRIGAIRQQIDETDLATDSEAEDD
jgi:exonuclease VII small subunit